MALNLPKILNAYQHAEDTTQRAFSAVKNAVDPLLNVVGSTFQILGDGSLSFIRTIRTFAADSIVANSSFISNGSTQLNSGVAVKGAATVQGTLVVQKLPDGSQGSFLVQNNATVNGALTSSTGFKSSYDMGVAWSSAAAVGTRYQSKRYLQNDNAASQFNAPTLFQPQYSGSIIGIHSYSQGTNGGSITINIYKNATLVNSSLTPFISFVGAAGGQYFGSSQLYAKGTYPFDKDNFFCASANWTASGNGLTFITLYVEYNA